MNIGTGKAAGVGIGWSRVDDVHGKTQMNGPLHEGHSIKTGTEDNQCAKFRQRVNEMAPGRRVQNIRLRWPIVKPDGSRWLAHPLMAIPKSVMISPVKIGDQNTFLSFFNGGKPCF